MFQSNPIMLLYSGFMQKLFSFHKTVLHQRKEGNMRLLRVKVLSQCCPPLVEL